MNIKNGKRRSRHREVRRVEIEDKVAEFMKKQMEQEKDAKKKEKVQVCIKPDSYIGKEIQYQTALLHQILMEIRKNKGSAKTAPVNQTD